MNLKSSDLTITAVNITPLLKTAYQKANGSIDGDYEIFNPSLIYDNGEYIACARVFLSRKGMNNRKSWEGRNATVFTRLDTDLRKVKGKCVVVSSLLNVAYRSSALSEFHPGTEDVRIQVVDGKLWAIGNEKVGRERKVVTARMDKQTFEIIHADVVFEDEQSSFEKNWSVFLRDGRWNVLYKLSPLETMTSSNNLFAPSAKRRRHSPSILDTVSETFRKVTGYNAEIRNRTSPVRIGKDTYLAMGGLVLDWKASDPQVNALLVPGIVSGDSDYSDDDAAYWGEKYHKLYLSFFYVFKMNGSDIKIDALSSFFQLPTRESRDELVVFPTTLTLHDKDVVISYGVGDNRSYMASIPFPLVELMLQDADNALLFQGLNISPDEPIHIARVARRVLKLDDRPSKYLLRDASTSN